MRYTRGDIVIARKRGANGKIQKGTRPYLIISNNKNNRFSEVLTVVPLTTQNKKPLPTHYELKLKGVENTILVEQLTCINKTDITSYIQTLGDLDMEKVEEKIKIQLDL